MIKLEGVADLKRNLSEIVTHAPEDGRVEMLEGAETIRQRIVDIVRRAPGAPDLADHIAINVDGERVAIGPSTDERSDQPGRSFDEQGQKLEYGTRYMAAFPFMRPAFDSQANTTAEGIARRVWQRLTGRIR